MSESSDKVNCDIYRNKCSEHDKSDILYLRNNRRIKRGCCLGHPEKRCIAFSGIDVDSGKLLYITEWNIKYSEIESKCSSNCFWLGYPKCNGHKVDDFINSVEKHVSNLSQMHHKNLISYECVLCSKRTEELIIYLVQEFVLGNNVFSITKSIGWSNEGVKIVVKGILNALIFLHNNGISYSYLCDKNIFLDNCGQVRCTNFSLVPHLLELVTYQKQKIDDFPALGNIIENLMLLLPYDIRHFVDKCKSNRTLSASELLNHPFLRRSSGHQLTSLSRIKTEFEILQYLEKGAFGDVLKVRNILDKKEYAIKRIPLSTKSEQLYEKMTREVELLSQLNHINVVRYFNSWIENSTLAELDDINSTANDDEAQQDVCIENLTNSKENSSSISNINNSDSGGVEFVNSDGKIIVYDENEISEDENSQYKNSSKLFSRIMYIQMEFCEKSTLREAIDDNLCKNIVRLWQLFREILEGLSYIHQQGIIHRDLKPVNIFLDSRDEIKIGDFGLATTSFLALQSKEHTNSNTTTTDNINYGTGKVGTTLYVAPELTGNASTSTYNQKVDMYTLGIILFEMSNPPYSTEMERIEIIKSLRRKEITLPPKMINDAWYEQTEIIRWLLRHEPDQRPSAKELLNSNLMLQGNFKAYIASEANFK